MFKKLQKSEQNLMFKEFQTSEQNFSILTNLISVSLHYENNVKDGEYLLIRCTRH
mgnify:FL=1